MVAVDGTAERQLTHHDGDFSGLAWSPDGTRLAAVATTAGRGDLVTVDPESGEVAVVVEGGMWSSPGWADAETDRCRARATAKPRASSPSPSAGRSPHSSTSPPPRSAAPPTSRPRAVTFASGDGLEIPAFLFRPPAADRGRVPAVVYPHGGPTSVYGDEWDGYAQYFIDKGYAWLALNFRGSTVVRP